MLGRTNIVRLPVVLMLPHGRTTVTIAHSRTPDLPHVCRQADILVAAIGRTGARAGLLDYMPGGIDIGINFKTGPTGKAKAYGDIAFDEAREVAGAIAPVPGGAGAMTVATLMSTLSTTRTRTKPHRVPRSARRCCRSRSTQKTGFFEAWAASTEVSAQPQTRSVMPGRGRLGRNSKRDKTTAEGN